MRLQSCPRLIEFRRIEFWQLTGISFTTKCSMCSGPLLERGLEFDLIVVALRFTWGDLHCQSRLGQPLTQHSLPTSKINRWRIRIHLDEEWLNDGLIDHDQRRDRRQNEKVSNGQAPD